MNINLSIVHKDMSLAYVFYCTMEFRHDTFIWILQAKVSFLFSVRENFKF